MPKATERGLAYTAGKAGGRGDLAHRLAAQEVARRSAARAVRVPQRQRAERAGGQGPGDGWRAVEVPILMDYNAMARHGIDPAKAMVAMPAMRTVYATALRRLLGKVGLRYEIRVDEAGKPFLWITTMKPV